MHSKEEKMQAFGRFLDVLDALRANCPWDKKQTNESLRPNTIEETYELCDALIKNDVHDICKELGDVLLHICFYAKIAEEKAQFDMADVCNALTRKMITRHPHVYHPSQIDAEDPKPLPYVPENESDSSQTKVTTVSQVLENWEQIKLKEKDGNESVLSGVPEALPSLIKAYRIQDKARNVGFDWEQKEDVWNKVREELDELEVELRKEDKENSTKELGDFLFSVIVGYNVFIFSGICKEFGDSAKNSPILPIFSGRSLSGRSRPMIGFGQSSFVARVILLEFIINPVTDAEK